MLKKEYRLSPLKNFWRTGSFRTPFFILYVKENGLLKSRFGFQVSKKVDKRAVVRNGVKRIFSKCIENNIEQIKTGCDMMFVVRKDALLKERKVLSENIITLFKKEKLLK